MFGLLTGLSSIQKYITLGLLIVILVGSGIGAWYFNYTQGKIEKLNKDLATSQANEITLKQNIELQNNSILLLEKKRAGDQRTVNELSTKFNKSQAEVDVLNKKLRVNRLKNLTLAKPRLIENIINKGSKKVMSDFENITDPDTFGGEQK